MFKSLFKEIFSKLSFNSSENNSLEHTLKMATVKYLNANHASNNSFTNPQKYFS